MVSALQQYAIMTLPDSSALSIPDIVEGSVQSSSPDDDAVLRRDIFIVTTVLKGHRYGPSERTPLTEDLSLLTHLAFALTTGHPCADKSGSRVVAVTGVLDAEGLKSYVLASNSQLHDKTSTNGHGEPVVVEHISPANPIKDLLDPKTNQQCVCCVVLSASTYRPIQYSGAVDFKTHVQDVFTVLDYCMRRGHSVTYRQRNLGFVFRFLIRRTYPKIRARLMNGANIWGTHPIRVIHEWYNNTASRSLDRKRFELSSYASPERLSQYGLSPCPDDATRYEVSSENATQWSSALLRCLERLEEVFHANQTECPPFFLDTVEKAQDALNMMVLLHCAVSSGIVKHLITNDLAIHLNERYQANMSPSRPGVYIVSVSVIITSR